MWDEERDPSAARDWTQVYWSSWWMQIIVAFFSFLASGAVVVRVLSQRIGTAPELYPVLWLSGSDLLLSLCFLLKAAPLQLCSHLTSIQQLLYLWTFLFTLNIVWNQFLSIRDTFICCITGNMGQASNRLSSRRKMPAVLCGILPVLLMTPVFTVSELRHCQENSTQPHPPDRCLLMDAGGMFVTSQQQQPIRVCRLLCNFFRGTFLCSFLITLTGITVLLVKSRRLLRRVVSCGGFVGNQQRALLRNMDHRMVLYPTVFLCCWSPAVVLTSLRLFLPSVTQGPTGAALIVTQVLTVCSGGFLNSLVYGCSRFRTFHREAHTQTPLTRTLKHREYHSLTLR